MDSNINFITSSPISRLTQRSKFSFSIFMSSGDPSPGMYLQVKIWFQNRRSKCKKVGKQGVASGQAMPPLDNESIGSNEEDMSPVNSRVEMDSQSTGHIKQEMAQRPVVECSMQCEQMGQSSGVSMQIANISPVYHQSVLNNNPPHTQHDPSTGYGPEATMYSMSSINNNQSYIPQYNHWYGHAPAPSHGQPQILT